MMAPGLADSRFSTAEFRSFKPRVLTGLRFSVSVGAVEKKNVIACFTVCFRRKRQQNIASVRESVRQISMADYIWCGRDCDRSIT